MGVYGRVEGMGDRTQSYYSWGLNSKGYFGFFSYLVATVKHGEALFAMVKEEVDKAVGQDHPPQPCPV